jgi:hypothetical protein
MTALKYTLVSDGSSDRALMPLVTWIIRQHAPDWAVENHWADFRAMRNPPRDLKKRIEASLDLYPCDLLVVHRDAERALRNTRVTEIRRVLVGIGGLPQVSFAIPVRMMEAWLLFNPQAIRGSAGNPNGRVRLDLPPKPDTIPHPERVLHDLLRRASGLRGRRLDRFNVDTCLHRLANLIEDYSPLRGLPAFADFEGEMRAALDAIRADVGP